jgi:hypothetical protein
MALACQSMFDKIRVSRSSLRKLEDSKPLAVRKFEKEVLTRCTASYALVVRGAEYANFPEALKDMVRLACDQAVLY